VTEDDPPERPNVLWLCSDQQRFDTLGCYGNAFVETPNLDALAAGGTRFEYAFSQSPICTPSRASFLTGRYPRTTRCRQNGQSIPDDEVLVTQLLQQAGYSCGLAGKFHLSACHPSVAPHAERRVRDGYGEFHWSHDAESYWTGNAYLRWLQDIGEGYQRNPFRGSPHVQTSVAPELHQSAWCADLAIDFIERRSAAAGPWLFSVNFFDPHHPFDPPESYLQRYLYRLSDVPLPNYTPGELEHKPAFQRNDHQRAYNREGFFPFPAMSDDDHRLVRAAYWAMIDLLDAQVGRILDALDRTGQRQNTLVVFMSDHGEMLGDHGIYLKGPYFYEPAIRVPLMLSWPGRIPAGRRSPALVELTDLAPTLLDAAGVERHPGMQGRSLWPSLASTAPFVAHRSDVYCEYYNARSSHRDPLAFATMVRDDRHKLVVVHGRGEGELYDLRDDPSESRNLWDDPAQLGVKAAMLERLCDRMAETVDPLPVREGPW
jgi:arylsulfatase A-like enzyme